MVALLILNAHLLKHVETEIVSIPVRMTSPAAQQQYVPYKTTGLIVNVRQVLREILTENAIKVRIFIFQLRITKLFKIKFDSKATATIPINIMI